MSLTLTYDELVELTEKRRADAQCRELERRGWIFEKSASGRPIVSRAYAEAKLGGRSSPESARVVRPNFDGLRRAG